MVSVVFLALLCAPIASRAQADDFQNDASPSPQEGAHHWDHEHPHHLPWALSISPRYYGLNTNGYSGAFTGNGFDSPKSGTAGWDFSFYWTTQTNWQLGFGLGDLGASQDLGSSEASFEQAYFGLWVGKEIPLCPDWDVSIGGLFAGGAAQVEVLSTTANGKVQEASFIFQPKVSVAYLAAPWFKVGVSGSYFEPLAQSDSVKGTNVTTGNISLHGLSGGVDFIFGRFDRD